MANLAGLLKEKGRHSEAEDLYRQALERVKNNYALLLKDRDDKNRFDHQKAEQLYREARAGGSAKLGLDHPDTLTFEHNLAALLGPSSDEAQELFLHVVAGSAWLSGGAGHGWAGCDLGGGTLRKSVFSDTCNLACLLEYKGDIQTAKEMQYRAYNGLLRRLRIFADSRTLSCDGFFDDWITLQHLEEAEPLCRRALRKREEMLGPEHRETLTSATWRRGEQLGIFAKGQEDAAGMAAGRYADSEHYYRRALDGFQQTLGADHRDAWLQNGYLQEAVHFINEIT
eukprot:Skav230888  [mRNA]  locus=scaffold2765:118411:127818:- [translate_table: standard]